MSSKNKYYARLNEEGKPIVLYRATPEMKEEVWSETIKWFPAEFLQDALAGHGNIYPIEKEDAIWHFSPWAFINFTPDDFKGYFVF